MKRSAPLLTLTVVALAGLGCKNQPEARYDSTTPEEQSYGTVPTQEALQTAADEDAARREQEEADAAAAAAKPKEPPPLSDADKTFVETAAAGGLAEVELSKAALEKAKKATVKDFAQKMIDQHTAANAELASLCTARGITLPSEPDEATKTKRAELEKKTGSKFEKAYVDIMLEDHRKAVELFRTESQSGADAELKAWAGATLPKLEEHLAHVEMLAKGKAYKPATTPPAQASAGTADAAAATK